MKIPHLLVHNKRDSVGVIVVESINAGQELLCVVTEDNSELTMVAAQAAPIGHKLALKDLEQGDTVLKYGHDIGHMISPAKRGEHIHVHNLKTKRW